MKLINKTVYNSDDLRALLSFLCVAHHCRKDKVIRIVYSRRGGTIGGHAAYGGPKTIQRRDGSVRRMARIGDTGGEARAMTLTLPGPSYSWPGPREADVPHFAQVFGHELAHNRGLEHGEMNKALRYCTQPPPAGIEAFQLRRECPQPAVRVPPPLPTPATLSPTMTPQEVKSVHRSIDAHVRAAAKEARTMNAQKREEKLRAKLAAVEAKLARLEKRAKMLRTKVAYYDRKTAKGA